MMEETSLRNRRGLRVPACIGILKRNTPLSSPSGWRDISATASDRTRDSDHGPGPGSFTSRWDLLVLEQGRAEEAPGPGPHARGTPAARGVREHSDSEVRAAVVPGPPSL